MAKIEETLKKLGLAAARGVPQLATGFVDLAALPFTLTGMMKPEQAFGSTAYLTSKGLLPPEQKGLLGETTELVSSALNPAAAIKGGLIGIGGTFIGKNAINWNKIAESEFLKLEKSGLSPQEIWSKTGTVRGFDGKLRQEVSDKDAKAFFTHLSESGNKRLSKKAIEHPEVYANYPQFESISQLGLRNKDTSGVFDANFVDGNFASGLLTAKAPNTELLKSAALHEMQHGVEAIEGFSRGADLQSMGKKEIAPVVMRRKNKLLDEALDLYGEGKIDEGKAKEALANKVLLGGKYRAYLRSGGEVDARLTQRRMNLTDEERLANFPYSRGEYGIDINPRKIIK
jgi:hypothetical protein